MQEQNQEAVLPADWIERYFWVPRPRNPKTGEILPAGPIQLTDHQKHLINEALSRNPDGTFKYALVVYSAPKKSGKSAVAAAVATYVAHHSPYGFIACVANDGKQANDRIYAPIKQNYRLHRQQQGPFKDINPYEYEVTLPNFCKIEAVPVDAAGEAGGEPTLSVFSELWGFDTPKKRQLWTELTVPPTLYGYAMQWVESYAGYTGVSILLESLYNTGKKEGTPHPDFSYLDTEEGPVVYTHAPSRMFMYWDTEPRMPWQIDDYYAEQRNTLEPEEFERIHRNRWVSAKGAFIEAQWWDNCESPSLPVLKQGDKTPVVVAIDMSVSNDLAAMVAVTRDPINPDTCVAVRAVKIFNPKKLGGNIDQEQTVGNTIREWASRWNVICWVYDPYQMAKLVQDYRKDGFGWFDPFTQNTARGIADKQLYDMVMHRQLTWNRTTTIGDVGGPGREEDTLYQHIRQAGAVISGRQRRLEKLSPEAKIDAAVALSMAAYKCMELELDNREFEKEDLLQMLAKGEIELETFSQIVRQKFPELGEKYINGSR